MIDLIDDKFKEECGVFGVFSKNNLDVARITYYGLYALQHRGQESAGIATSNGKEITLIKNLGLVTEAFNESDLDKLKGNIAIGHVRYSTCGANNVVNAQPLFSSTKLGNIAVAHNGTLVNADVIKDLLEDSGCIFHTTIDSEVIISLIARNAKSGIEKAVFNAVQAIRGSFAMVILT